jgi:adenylate cyclase
MTGLKWGEVGHSLKAKLSLLITAVLVLAILLVVIVLLRQQQQSLTVEMTKRGRAIAENLAAGAKSSLLQRDDLTLSVLVKDAMKDSDVAYIIIADEKGQIRAHSDINKIGEDVERPAPLAPAGDQITVTNYHAASRGGIIDFAVPLTFSRVRLGALYLGFSEESIVAAVGKARRQAGLVTLGMVSLGIAAAVGLATLLSRPIFRLVSGTRAIAGGDFTVSLPVTSHDELGTLTQSFNQMAKSLREKEMIKRAFSRYVAREVVEEVLKDPEQLQLKGERREVTVLFCDVRGFTPMSEKLTPEQVVSLLNDYYTLMIELTFKHDGTLDKFLGDGVMAIFGAPIAYADHALHACRAALAMQAGIARLSAARVADGKEPIVIGIGVNAGEVVAGTVGTEERMEYTVIGDNVNLASRLTSNANPGQILISRRTLDLAGDGVDVRPLGTIHVKGKEGEVEAFELIGLKGQATGRKR